MLGTDAILSKHDDHSLIGPLQPGKIEALTSADLETGVDGHGAGGVGEALEGSRRLALGHAPNGAPSGGEDGASLGRESASCSRVRKQVQRGIERDDEETRAKYKRDIQIGGYIKRAGATNSEDMRSSREAHKRSKKKEEERTYAS